MRSRRRWRRAPVATTTSACASSARSRLHVAAGPDVATTVAASSASSASRARRNAGAGDPIGAAGLHQDRGAREAAERDGVHRERRDVGREHVCDEPGPDGTLRSQLALDEVEHRVDVERLGDDVERRRRRREARASLRPAAGSESAGSRRQRAAARASAAATSRRGRRAIAAAASASRLDRIAQLVESAHGTRSASRSPHPRGGAPWTRPTTSIPSSPTVRPRSSVSTTETDPALARSW